MSKKQIFFNSSRSYLIWILLILVLALFLPVITFSQEYLVGEGDLLRITVYNNPDLATDVRISGDGKIKVPLIDEVMVKGLTTMEIGTKLAQLYADGYLINPQVSVFILEYKSKKVTALGEFSKPGIIELRGEATLMEVISNAGGITAAAGETLIIQRKSQDDSGARKNDVKITINLVKLLESGDPSVNIPLIDGDSIYVPRAAYVYVTGEVRTPGAYKITKGLTVLRSITLAGGFSLKARESRTQIIRKSEKGEITMRVKMDDLVFPDDIIVVPESIF